MVAGYRVSKKKAQIYREEVRYLGFVLKKGTRFQTLIGVLYTDGTSLIKQEQRLSG